MSNHKQKLELTWIGKNNPDYDIANIEPRILEENPRLSNVKKDPNTENMLIHGDNLLALKALLPEYESRIKCIYIDPPYNTGNAFEHYDDCVEHSTWLSLMKPRLELLKMLLRPDGFLCCHIDDSEGQYLKVLLDEVFGRSNYLTTFYVQVRYPEKTLKQDMAFHKEIEQVHIYRRDYGAQPIQNEKPISYEKFRYYVEERGTGREIELGGKRAVVFGPDEYQIKEGEGSRDGLKEIWATGTILDGNSSGRFFRDHLAGRVTKDGLGTLYKVYGIGDDQYDYRYFTGPKRAGATKGKYFQGVPVTNLGDSSKISRSPIENFYDLAAAFGNCRHEGGVEFRSGKKPEKLLQIILSHFSSQGDWVLDSFAGSGTTGAVAHKWKRRWIMVELGEHAGSHIVPRMRRVIDGKDLSGATRDSGWVGGGGFRYFELAPSFIAVDEFGNPVIDSFYNDTKLIRAMCKLTNYTFAPSQKEYWKHGKGQGNNSIYVTTQMLSVAMVQQIARHLRPNESLLICPKKYEPGCETVDKRITIKKIPQSVLKACHFGKKEYLLPIKHKSIEEIDIVEDDNE